MGNTMKALVYQGPGVLTVEEREIPVPKKGEVQIKIHTVSICGSDLGAYRHASERFMPPLVLGHEFSGVVEEVGEGVTSVKPGDRVSGVPLVPCMKCEDCQKGDYSLCKHYSFIGSREFGSFAEYVAVPERNTVKFDDTVSFEMGAFFEPATVALHGLRRVDYKGGKHVAILGGGTIGLLTAQWAKIFGARSVTVFDILEERLDLAKRLGIDYGVNTKEADFMEKAMEITQGRGFDYVYETAGNTVTMKLAFQLAANKAGVCFIGTPTKELSFSVEEWENMNRKEFMLTGSWMSYSAPFPGDEWKLVAHYFKTGQLKLDESFIFRKMPLSKIAEAFEMFKTPGLVRGKILIDSEK